MMTARELKGEHLALQRKEQTPFKLSQLGPMGNRTTTNLPRQFG